MLQCFQKACFPGASKGVIGWEWVNTYEQHSWKGFNTLPKDKILNQSKLEAFADDKILVDVNEKLEFGSGRAENIVGKGENAGYQHFLLLPKLFSKAPCFRVVKSRVWVVKSKTNAYNALNLYQAC